MSVWLGVASVLRAEVGGHDLGPGGLIGDVVELRQKESLAFVLRAVGAHEVIKVLKVLVLGDCEACPPDLLLDQVRLIAGCTSSLNV